VLMMAGVALLSLAQPMWAQSLPSASATSSSTGTESEKAKKALDAARLWLQEAKRRLNGGNERALGYITVALQKIEAAKGDIAGVEPTKTDAAETKGSDPEKAKKALDAARLWVQEAKRHLNGDDKALGLVAVALQKIVAAKGDIDRVEAEKVDAVDAANARADRQQAAAEKAAADKAAADQAAREKAEADKAAQEKAEIDRINAERAQRQAAREKREKAAAEKAAAEKAAAGKPPADKAPTPQSPLPR
jgi:hypothetical protein